MQTQKPKQGYKLVRSSYGRLQEVPMDWSFTRLDRFLEVNMGQSPTSEKYNTGGEGLPFYQGVTDFGYQYPTPKTWCTEPGKIADSNELLFSVRAPVGEVNVTNTPCGVGRGVASLKPKGSDLKYCYYLLKQFRNYFLTYSQGTTYDSINRDEIRQSLFPYTSDPTEQQKISSILSKVDDLIQKTDEIIGQTKRLKKGLMQRLLTKGIGHKKFKSVKFLFGKEIEIPVEWNVVKLIELCKEKPQYGAAVAAIKYDQSLPRYIRITDITDEGSLNSEPASITEENANAYLMSEGEILFARTGATVGKTYLCKKEDGLCAFAGYLIRFIPDETKLNARFLFHYTHSGNYWRWLLSNFTQGVQPNVNAEQYSHLSLLAPPIGEQQKIADVLDMVSTKVQQEQNNKGQLDLLKKGLMQKLLTGQIRVKV